MQGRRSQLSGAGTVTAPVHRREFPGASLHKPEQRLELMDKIVTTHDIFPHIRIVLGMIIGLGVARLLSGVARIIQHPKQYRLYSVHLAWVVAALLMLVHFWWWEFGLFQIGHWTFGTYLFLIGYAIVLFLICAMLFPDSMEDYSSYENYFYSRRAWLFGLLALAYALDVVDTFLKGKDHFAQFGHEYLFRTPVLITLCVIAALTDNRKFHTIFVLGTLVYQTTWILRLFDTIG